MACRADRQSRVCRQKGRPCAGKLGATVVPFRRQSGVRDESIEWLPGRELHLDEQFRTLDAIVHLAGEPIVGQWTTRKKREIERSRVEGTTIFVRLWQNSTVKSQLFVRPARVSTAPYHQNATESDPLGAGFLAQVCAKWEAATSSASAAGHRVVIPRIG